MKEIHKIVITGGPCGGKTTALEVVSKIFREEGFTVLTVNETATELIKDGIKPFGNEKDRLKILDFQKLILEAQLAKEKIREYAANVCENEKVVILHDRGIFDNRAYLTDEEFQKMIEEKGLKEAKMLSNYDLVIHLVTAANGKEEYYTTLNNTARTETPEEARKKDDDTMEAWSNHPNLKIVGNDCLFDEKMHIVGNIIRDHLGKKEVIEQEKYIVEFDRFDLVELCNKQLVHMFKEEIVEFAKSYNDTEDEMYRKSTINGSSYYTYTKIRYNVDGTKTTVQRNVTEEEFLNELDKIDGEGIEKTRYNFIFNGERYRLDMYHDPSKLTTLERDVTNKKNKTLPGFIKSKHEITDDRDYSTLNIYNYLNEEKKKRKKEEIRRKLKIRTQEF